MENPHVLEDIEEIVREEGIIERALKQWDTLDNYRRAKKWTYITVLVVRILTIFTVELTEGKSSST